MTLLKNSGFSIFGISVNIAARDHLNTKVFESSCSYPFLKTTPFTILCLLWWSLLSFYEPTSTSFRLFIGQSSLCPPQAWFDFSDSIPRSALTLLDCTITAITDQCSNSRKCAACVVHLINLWIDSSSGKMIKPEPAYSLKLLLKSNQCQNLKNVETNNQPKTKYWNITVLLYLCFSLGTSV